jgi:hypothetical protein
MARFIVYIIVGLALQSCYSSTPTGFWRKFENNDLKNELSSQGLYGGHRALFWETKQNKKINVANIISFAKLNGWIFKDRINFNAEIIRNWLYNNQPIFPLSHQGFTSTIEYNDADYIYFPLKIKSDATVYIFETNWTKVETGTAEFTNAFGYVILNKEKNLMAVYHLWGE